MVKGLLVFVLMCCVLLPTCAYAQSGQYAYDYQAQPEHGSFFPFDYGVFGCAYKLVIGVCKVGETIVFGRFGFKGLGEYLRVDQIFHENTPKY